MWTIWKRLAAPWAQRPAVGTPRTPTLAPDLSDETLAASWTLRWLKAYIEALERGCSETEAYDAMMATITKATGPSQRANEPLLPGAIPLSQAWELWSALPTFDQKRRAMAEIIASLVEKGYGDEAKKIQAANTPVFTSFAAVEFLLGGGPAADAEAARVGALIGKAFLAAWTVDPNAAMKSYESLVEADVKKLNATLAERDERTA